MDTLNFILGVERPEDRRFVQGESREDYLKRRFARRIPVHALLALVGEVKRGFTTVDRIAKGLDEFAEFEEFVELFRILVAIDREELTDVLILEEEGFYTRDEVRSRLFG